MRCNFLFRQVFLRLDELMFYALQYFSALICSVKGAVFNTYWMIKGSQTDRAWFWTDLELTAGTGICAPLEVLGHGSMKFSEYFLFKFYFVWKLCIFFNPSHFCQELQNTSETRMRSSRLWMLCCLCVFHDMFWWVS